MPEQSLIRVPIFPLAGALLFPRTQLPLHIFEPRYRAMVRDALAGDRLIAMVQPRDAGEPPRVFEIGCLGRIVSSEELSDGRYNIVLEGINRVRIAHEASVTTPYRQVDADSGSFKLEEEEPLANVQRADLERESRRYADALGYAVDWEAVARLDDQMLVNGIAQIIPLDIGAKQALLEAEGLSARAELLVQFMEFQRMLPGGPEGARDVAVSEATGLDEALLGKLVCPLTRTALRYDRQANELISEAAGLAFPVRDGVPVMLVEEARRL